MAVKVTIKIEPVTLGHPVLLGLNAENGFKEIFIPATFNALDAVLGSNKTLDLGKYGQDRCVAVTLTGGVLNEHSTITY